MKRLFAVFAAALFCLAVSVPAFAAEPAKKEAAPAAVKTDNTVEKKEGKEMKKEGVKPKKQKKESAGC